MGLELLFHILWRFRGLGFPAFAILRPFSAYMGTFLGPKCIPYTYMEPLGLPLPAFAMTDFGDNHCVKPLQQKTDDQQ